MWARQPLLLQLPGPIDFTLDDLEAALTLTLTLTITITITSTLTLPSPNPNPSPHPHPTLTGGPTLSPTDLQAALVAGVFASAAGDDPTGEACLGLGSGSGSG